MRTVVLGLLVASCGGGSAPGGASPASPQAAAAGSGGKVETPDGPPHDVDCGDFTTCAIGSDGLARCWGRDKRGELGSGVSSEHRARHGVVPGIGKVVKVALASQFGCAILEDKTVKCWGTGRIANDGKAMTDAKPTPVAGVDGATELVASGAIVCARANAGTVCWGSDEKTIGTAPKTPFKQLAAGFTHACGLDDKGAVQCWGSGDWGGSGAFAKPPIAGASVVATGDRHGCAIVKGAVQCWGMNDAGQLGTTPDMEPHKKPVTVPGVSGATKLATGEASTCAVVGDGSVHCWGQNGEGELGLGTRSPDERPAKVNALDGVEHLCLASAHGCALTKQSKLMCWGSNAFGQLGDGTKERRSSPTPVAW